MIGFKTKERSVRVYTSEVEGHHLVIDIKRNKKENTREEYWDMERGMKRVAGLKKRYLG